MFEQDKPATGVPEGTPEAPAETPAADSRPEEQTTAPASEEAPKADETPSAPAEPVKPTDSGQSKESKPTSRRSAQYRIEQLARENAELKKNQAQPKPAEATPDDEGEPQPHESVPDISKQVQEEVDRRLAPVLSEHSKAADDTELSELFTGDLASKRAKYEPAIRELWKLPQYKDVAAKDLYRIAAFEATLVVAQTQAVENYKKALKEAKDSSSGGTSARKGEKSESAWDLTEKEFKEKTDKARMTG